MCPQDWTLEGLLCSARGAKTPRTKSCSSQVNGSKFHNEIPLKKKKKIFFFLLSSTFLQQDNLTLGALFCFFPFFSSFLLKCDCCSEVLHVKGKTPPEHLPEGSLLSALHDPWAAAHYHPSTQQGRSQTHAEFTTHTLSITKSGRQNFCSHQREWSSPGPAAGIRPPPLQGGPSICLWSLHVLLLMGVYKETLPSPGRRNTKTENPSSV